VTGELWRCFPQGKAPPWRTQAWWKGPALLACTHDLLKKPKAAVEGAVYRLERLSYIATPARRKQAFATLIAAINCNQEAMQEGTYLLKRVVCKGTLRRRRAC